MHASPKKSPATSINPVAKELQNAVKEVDEHASLLFYVVSIGLIKVPDPTISEVFG